MYNNDIMFDSIAKEFGNLLLEKQKMKIRVHIDYAIMIESNGCVENLQNRLSLDETRVFIDKLIEHNKDY